MRRIGSLIAEITEDMTLEPLPEPIPTMLLLLATLELEGEKPRRKGKNGGR
jgi:hypothetical protein